MGNDDNSPTDKVYGGLYPARLWKGFMERALEGAPKRPLPRPEAKAQSKGTVDRLVESAKEALSGAEIGPARSEEDFEQR